MAERPTNDCGWWSQVDIESIDRPSSRYRPDGSLAFTVGVPDFSLARIELTDGSWLLVRNWARDGATWHARQAP